MTAATALQATYGGNDPHFPKVLFLSGFPGANFSTTIIDESSNAASYTSYDAGSGVNRSYVSTALAKYGSTSFEVLEAANTGFTMSHARFARAAGQLMTYEGWIYPSVRGMYSSTPLVIKVADTVGNQVFAFSIYSAGDQWTFRPGLDFTSTFSHGASTGSHIFWQVFLKADDTFEVWMDGVLKVSRSGVPTFAGVTHVSIGGIGGGGGSFSCQAFFDDIRITRDVLRPTAVPAGRFPRR